MILKATINNYVTEVVDIPEKQRIDNFILMIISLCIDGVLTNAQTV